MDAWRMPDRDRVRLDASEIRLEAGAATVTLARPERSQRIACDDADVATRVAAFLRWLQQPGNARGRYPDAAWSAEIEPELLPWLDANAWLANEDGSEALLLLEAQAERIAGLIGTAVEALVDAVPDSGRQALAETLARVAGWDAARRDPVTIACAEACQDMAVLRLTFAYLERNAPMIHAALRSATGLAARRIGSATGGDAAASLPPTAFGETDPAALEIALTQWHACLTRAVVAPRPLRVAGLDPCALGFACAPCTGAAFAHQLERFVDVLLARLGPNPYLERLRAVDDGRDPLLQGLAIEEFHVTRRFVEIIAPMLCRRPVPGLRTLMFRYYAEEVGHEAFEEATCLAHGIDRAALHASLPLPLHAGFVDAFTVVAQLRPMAFLGAVMVTEGLFGRPSPLGDRVRALSEPIAEVQAVCTRHNDLNACLHHDTITRHAFDAIEVLDAATAADALRGVALLCEINARTWEDLAAFYSVSPVLHLHGFLGRRIDPAHGCDPSPAGV